TQSGFSARLISSERPDVPMVALTPFPEVQRRLGLYWGVSSRLIRKVETTDEMVHEVEATLLGDGTVRNGDVIVIVSGAPMWVTATATLLQLHGVGARRASRVTESKETAMGYETIRYEVRDGVATITLNRPEAYNALNLTLGRELFHATLEADEDRAVRCIV